MTSLAASWPPRHVRTAAARAGSPAFEPREGAAATAARRYSEGDFHHAQRSRGISRWARARAKRDDYRRRHADAAMRSAAADMQFNTSRFSYMVTEKARLRIILGFYMI